MLRIVSKSKLGLKLVSSTQSAVFRRTLSSLGNPMFPHRPLPELETFQESIENSKKAKQENKDDPEKKGFVDILADHGGKIAMVVFGGIIALFYTYYLSGKDRNKIEDGISDASMLDPYEIQELRFVNKLSKEDFVSIAAQCKENFHTGKATYAEFVQFLRDKVTLPETTTESSASRSARPHSAWSESKPAASTPNAPRRLALQSTHLLDRVIMGYVQRAIDHDASSPSSSSSSSSADSTRSEFHGDQAPGGGRSGLTATPSATVTDQHGAPVSVVSWTSTPLDVDLLLVILSLTMVPDAEARVQALFDLAKLYPVGEMNGQDSNHYSNYTSSNNSDTDHQGDASNGSSMDTSGAGDTLTQETVTRVTTERLIKHLIETDQIPAVKQTMESGVKYPVKLHRRKNEADMVADYEVKQKLTQKIHQCDYDKFRAVLLSYQVCAWGECYTAENLR